MKTIITLLFVSGALTFFVSLGNTHDNPEDSAIHFTVGTFNDVQKKAREENKVIFMDVYASWCGPCKLLKKTTFTDKELGAYFNTNFINIAIDGETVEGKNLMQLYKVRSYPTMLFINPDGSVKQAAVGYHTANQLLKVAKKATN